MIFSQKDILGLKVTMYNWVLFVDSMNSFD
jgi:hypothetical protein